MKTVEPGMEVEVAYTLRADGPDGEELETCTEEAPFVFRVDADEALPAFEAALRGLKEGEPFSFSVPCQEAYGEETEDAVVALPKSAFMVDGKLDEEVMKVGEVVPMADEDGEEIIGIVVEVEPELVHVDFNHPLAGLDLHFEGTICAIRSA